MTSTRLEAFSDGVIAIIITIMVLELHVPHGGEAHDLLNLAPVFLSYVLSFVSVAIYWINHHHLIYLVRRVDARLLWANMHLLFWMSLLPFVTGYLGENHLQPFAVALYSFVGCGSAMAFALLRMAVARRSGKHHEADFVAAHRRFNTRNWIAGMAQAVAIPLAFVSVWIALPLLCLPPLMYFLPDDDVVESLATGKVDQG